MGNISKIMEFIKNNLPILVTATIAAVSGIFNIYQYNKNRNLKKYDAEKNLKKRRADLKKLNDDHSNPFLKPILLDEIIRERNEFDHKKSKLEAEIEYLKKILKIKHDD